MYIFYYYYILKLYKLYNTLKNFKSILRTYIFMLIMVYLSILFFTYIEEVFSENVLARINERLNDRNHPIATSKWLRLRSRSALS